MYNKEGGRLITPEHQTPNMKLLVGLSLFVALSAGSPIEITIPLDNSHYVEGVSRYIWMPDGNDVPQLVDLQAPAEPLRGAENQYLLFTRSNPENPQELKYNDRESVRNSNYNRNWPIVVIVHGWTGDINSKVNPYVRDAMLEVGNYNVIALDWHKAAGGLYTSAIRNVFDTGESLGFFLDWLIFSFGGSWNNVHLVGYSLGAHVVANVGRMILRRPGRITGLDPAGPQFGNNPDALNIQDAAYVECMATDGGMMGIFDPICQANFYPNGGRHPQPGCDSNSCSHSRAYELYAASVRYNRFVGRQCASLDDAENQRCDGAEFLMGNADLNKRRFGLFGLKTEAAWPF
ncbi:unnamed protein product [Leptosia nina]|uniref:Lipase domain-containing protein n=1 Tax=Leptosia nina TaxID=320188 RepID=A0AAV1J624_9NEOP